MNAFSSYKLQRHFSISTRISTYYSASDQILVVVFKALPVGCRAITTPPGYQLSKSWTIYLQDRNWIETGTYGSYGRGVNEKMKSEIKSIMSHHFSWYTIGCSWEMVWEGACGHVPYSLIHYSPTFLPAFPFFSYSSPNHSSMLSLTSHWNRSPWSYTASIVWMDFN